MSGIIEFDHYSFRYELAERNAINDFSYQFEPGVVYGVIGSNGSGKTTLCNAIKGRADSVSILALFRGNLMVLGKDMSEWDPRELSYQIGYVFQNPFTQISGVKDTVFEEVAIGLENLGVPTDEIISRVIEAVKIVGIEDLIRNNPNELSGGQRQRVAFASILVMNNDIPVIDEPTSQLDPEGTENIFNIIRNLKEQDKTVILVEHKVDRLAEYAEKMIVMHQGHIISEGDTRKFSQTSDLIKQEVLLPSNCSIEPMLLVAIVLF